MKRNTITIIELVIVICVIVVAVRVWAPHKETGVQPVHNLFRPNVNKPRNENYCPKCGSNELIFASYNSEVSETPGKWLEGKMCRKCHWLSFKCPKCGGEVYKSPPFNSGVPGACSYISVGCKKCNWYSDFR